MYPSEMKTHMHANTRTQAFTALLPPAKKWKQLKRPSADDWADSRGTARRWNVIRTEEEWSPDTRYNMDEPWKRDAEGKGSDTRYMIPFTANIQNKQSHRREVDEWFPGLRAWREGNGERQLMGLRFPSEVTKMFYNWLWRWLPDSVKILKTTDLHTFSGAFMGCELYLIKAGLHKAWQLSHVAE